MPPEHSARRTVLALVVLAPLAGCGGKPMAFPIPESEMPPAPGLFTGQTGSYEVPIVKGTQPAPSADPKPTGGPK